jgi:hypothetical protein
MPLGEEAADAGQHGTPGGTDKVENKGDFAPCRNTSGKNFLHRLLLHATTVADLCKKDNEILARFLTPFA